jgi:tight adherence protein C
MNLTSMFEIGFAFAAVMTPSAIIVDKAVRRHKRIAARIGALRSGGAMLEGGLRRRQMSPVDVVAALGGVIARSGLLSASTLADLRGTLSVAGFRGSQGLAVFVGSKLMLMLTLPVISHFLLHALGVAQIWHNLGVGAGAIFGLLAPDYYVKRLRQRTMDALERGMPDALDMMIICTEAGLSLEPAIERVAREIAPAHPVVAYELRQTQQALQMNPDRRAALMAMGSRTGLLALQRLAVTLVQSLQYGTPLSHALRMLSVEMRQEQLNQFEARAAKLPVLLTVPMILFILPTIFLVVIGPAAVNMMNAHH